MKITKARLKEIIKEELQVTLTNEEAGEMFGDEVQEELEQQDEQLDESIDVSTLEKIEASVTPELANAVIAAYKEMTTPTDVDQVYAGTGEPVSKDPQDMHDKAVEMIGEIIFDQSKKIPQDGMRIDEDGHTDVPSAARKMKLAIEDAGQILQGLQAVDGELPAWWMSKVTLASEYLNKARDYLLVPSEPMEENKMTPRKKKKLKGLEKKVPKKVFTDQYGKAKEEEVYYATLTKQAMAEGHGLEQKDIDYLSKVIDKSDDKELKKILRFIKKSNIKVDKTKDLSKEKKEEREMKITKQRLEEIIQEELEAYMLEEGIMDFGKKIGKKAKGVAAALAMMGALAGSPADAMAKEPTKSSSVQKDERMEKLKMAIAYLQFFEENKIKELEVMLMGIKTRPKSPERTQKILDYSEQISNISNKYMQYTKGILKGDEMAEKTINKINDHIDSLDPQLKKEIQRRASELKDLKQISF